MKKKMLSPSQFAEKIGRPYPTVMAWLKRDLIQGVEKHEVGKSVLYEIPEDATYSEPTMGRPKKATTDTPAALAPARAKAKKASNGAVNASTKRSSKKNA